MKLEDIAKFASNRVREVIESAKFGTLADIEIHLEPSEVPTIHYDIWEVVAGESSDNLLKKGKDKGWTLDDAKVRYGYELAKATISKKETVEEATDETD